MGGQIVDATIVEARRPRLTQAEKGVVKGGGVPEDWKPARTRQIDREGRWTLKRGKTKPRPPDGSARAATPEIAVPMFGYKNHVGIDRAHGFVRRFTVTHAAAHDGAQLGAVLDPANTASAVWADTAYRSAANIEMLARRGLKPQFQRPKPRGKPMPRHIARGNARRAESVARRARLRRPEAPLRPGDPHRRQGPRHRQAGARQPRLQLHPVPVAGDPKRRLNATPTALRGQGAAQQEPATDSPAKPLASAPAPPPINTPAPSQRVIRGVQ